MIHVGMVSVKKVRKYNVLEAYYTKEYVLAKQFIERCLTIDVEKRITAHEALEHEWLIEKEVGQFEEKHKEDLLPNLRTNFNARRTFKKAINMVTLSNHFGHLSKQNSTNTTAVDQLKPVNEGIDQVLETSEKESV